MKNYCVMVYNTEIHLKFIYFCFVLYNICQNIQLKFLNSVNLQRKPWKNVTYVSFNFVRVVLISVSTCPCKNSPEMAARCIKFMGPVHVLSPGPLSHCLWIVFLFLLLGVVVDTHNHAHVETWPNFRCGGNWTSESYCSVTPTLS